MLGVGQPVRPVGDEGPGADLRDPARQRVDIAVGAVGLVDLGGVPGVGDAALLHQKAVNRGDELGSRGRLRGRLCHEADRARRVSQGCQRHRAVLARDRPTRVTATAAAPIRVLLVEDNPGDARIILEMLREVAG